MSAATKSAKSPLAPSRPVCPAVAARLAVATAGSRQLTPEEFDLARFVVRRWKSARSIVAKLYGSADETDEYTAARHRRESFGGDASAYAQAAQDGGGLLTPADLQSYARYAAFKVAEPQTIERAVWAMLRSAEVDIVRLIEALNAEFAGSVPDHGADLTIDGLRFSVGYLDSSRDPEYARLIVGYAQAMAAPGHNAVCEPTDLATRRSPAD